MFYVILYLIVSIGLTTAAVHANLVIGYECPWRKLPARKHWLFGTLTFFLWPIVLIYGFIEWSIRKLKAAWQG